MSASHTRFRPPGSTPSSAILFALTAFFKKANEIEAGHLDQVDAAEVALR